MRYLDKYEHVVAIGRLVRLLGVFGRATAEHQHYADEQHFDEMFHKAIIVFDYLFLLYVYIFYIKCQDKILA